METKANTALIGAFTLGVIALAFAFVYWLAGAGQGSDSRTLTVHFPGSVTGLAAGSPVLFNGLKMGEVRDLRVDPSDPGKVTAELTIDGKAPVKPDTKATLTFQGLTGVGLVELSGGSHDAPNLLSGDEPAVLEAESSAMVDLMASARGILSRADQTLSKVDQLVSDNAESVGRTIRNVETFTGALSKNADKVENFVASFSKASEGITGLTDRIGSVVTRVDGVLAAVEPEKVRGTIDNVATFSGALAEQSGQVKTLVEGLVKITKDVSSVSGRLAAFGEKAEALFTDIAGKAVRLLASVEPEKVKSTIDSIERAAGNVDRIAAAVPSEAVGKTVDNLTAFSDTLLQLAGRREDIDGVITRLTTISNDAAAFSARLPGLGEKMDSLVADVGGRAREIVTAVDPAQVSRALTGVEQAATGIAGAASDVRALAAAVAPETVQTTVRNLSTFSETLAGLASRREDLDGIVTRMAAITGDVNGFTARLPAIGDKVEGVINSVSETAGRLTAAVDPEAVGRAVGAVERAAGNVERITAAVPPETIAAAATNIAAFSETLAGRREDIDALVTQLSTIATDVGGFSAHLPSLGERAEEIAAAIDPEALDRAVSAVERAATGIESAAAAIPADAVRETVENIRAVSETLAGRREDIDTLVTRLSSLSGRADALVAAMEPETVRAAVADLARVAAGIDPNKILLANVDTATINQSIGQVSRFATALGERSGDVAPLMSDARLVASRLASLSQKADNLLTKLDGMAGDESGEGGFIAEARSTLASIRQAADSFDKQAQSIGSNVNQFSTRGLRDLQEFVNEGRRTVTRLDRVIGNLERDPSQILFGGADVPEYKGSRAGGSRSGTAPRR